MPRFQDTIHSVLVVSGSGKFNDLAERSLQGFSVTDYKKNAAAARRCILERYYDLVVINAPLPDETGERFALDITQQSNASVLLVVPSEVYEEVLGHVTGYGVMTLSKPMHRGQLDHAIEFLAAVQKRMHHLENKIRTAEEKLEEQRIVNRAKILLIEERHMTENEAHRYIGKQAMDNGISRRRIAERILEEFEE